MCSREEIKRRAVDRHYDPGTVKIDPARETSGPASVPPASLVPWEHDPNNYINRELSWLEFNARVLAEAASPEVPLFERLKFLGIFAGNLDEFFMVRVAGLQAQTLRTIHEAPPDGMSPQEQLMAIRARATDLVDTAYRIYHERVAPGLRLARITLARPEQLSTEEQARLDERFRTEIFPVLTPLAIDPGHPFPHLRNKSINLGIMFNRAHSDAESGFGVLQVPAMLPRLWRVHMDGFERAFVLLEDIIARHVKEFFPAARVRGTYPFRVTRNWDLEIDEEEGDDLLLTIQAELRRRDRGSAVRLEIVAGSEADSSVLRLCKALHVDPAHAVYRVAGPLHLNDLTAMVADDERREFRDEPFTPQLMPPLRDVDDFFSLVRERDVLLHHPYESFEPVVEFLNRAADDPHVLAIKQTLYRTGNDSPIVKALARAAENGKQVTAVVELKARFDEASNIEWARTLEQAGVQVIYGLLGLKTHAKALLVVRREKDKLRRYVHLSTGNYNPGTARSYTDLALLTAKTDFGEDATSLFNLLTGYTAPQKWNKLVVAPLGLHETVLGLIAREAANARAGRKASIVARMNSLVDVDVIDALYAASQAGVDVRLRIRGICCLRPGVPGLSERIEVRALIDRFLEHQRVFRFENAGAVEIYMSSADWMPRNFHRRVEIMFPIDDPACKAQVEEILQVMDLDTAKTWVLNSAGTYARSLQRSAESLTLRPGEAGSVVRGQQRLIELNRERLRQVESKARGERLHVLGLPTEPETRSRRARSGKKKRIQS